MAEAAAETRCFGGIERVATRLNEQRDKVKADGGYGIVPGAGDRSQGGRVLTDGPTGQRVANDGLAYVEKPGTVTVGVDGRIRKPGQWGA